MNFLRKTAITIALALNPISFNVVSGETTTIRLGHAMSEATDASQAIHAFSQAVTKLTNGRVTIEDFPNSQLGSETEMLEQLQIGALGAAAIMCGTMQALDMKMAIEDLPYMWKDKIHARKAFDGEFGQALADIMKAKKIHKVGYVEWGFRHITNNEKPIVKPHDVKGLKIRVAQTKMRVDTFKKLDALPMVLSFSELYGALQQGVVDAQENPLSNIAAANFNEVQKYLSLTGHFYNTAMLVITDKVWGKISKNDQEIILEQAKALSEKVRKANDSKEEEYINTLAKRGMKINDNVNKAAFREATLSVYDDWESKVFGQSLMDIYRAASGY